AAALTHLRELRLFGEYRTELPAVQKRPVAAIRKLRLVDTPTGPRQSLVCLILAVISFICIVYATLLITVQFLDLTQGQSVAQEISSILPLAK
ncbi:MAG: hypothetical protein J5862_01875, partial [Bacteroidales bacterium]|nr:hypothetical protein [Bacteroidales bacterium]